jgi:hypothetical protein
MNDPHIKKFGYHDGGLHCFNPEVSANLVIIGTASFLNDTVCAVEDFMNDCGTNAALRARVQARLPKVHRMIPFPRP